MFDPKSLLDQFLGSQSGTAMRDAGQSMKGRLDQYSGSGGFMRGAAAGGLLGVLLGGRRRSGGLLQFGGAAALGALALKAYQDYQQRKGAASAGPGPAQWADLDQGSLPHACPAADGGSFQLVLIRAMVGAVKADGAMDAGEQQRLFSEVDRLGLDADAKAYVLDLLSKPVDIPSITDAVATPEQGAEVYLASRMAIDPDVPAERAYLDALAQRLKLPVELRAHLDTQAASHS